VKSGLPMSSTSSPAGAESDLPAGVDADLWQSRRLNSHFQWVVVYAAVNLAAVRLASETGAKAAMLCLIALAVTIWQFLTDPATVNQALAIAAIVVLAVAIEAADRIRS
jgi:hypothetical protein